jgi:hypothetical protein
MELTPPNTAVFKVDATIPVGTKCTHHAGPSAQQGLVVFGDQLIPTKQIYTISLPHSEPAGAPWGKPVVKARCGPKDGARSSQMGSEAKWTTNRCLPAAMRAGYLRFAIGAEFAFPR